MLKLLLDEHISPVVAAGLIRRHPSLAVHSMTKWEDGRFLGQDDSAFLEHASEQGLTLATYDRRTIPPLLKLWGEEGRDRGGVIFIDEKTISPADLGGQVHALSNLIRASAKWNWTNRVCFLQR